MSVKVSRKFDSIGRVIEAEGTCSRCHRTIDFMIRDCYDTVECDHCGKLYNSGGQELRPRSQWEEQLDPDY